MRKAACLHPIYRGEKVINFLSLAQKDKVAKIGVC